MLRYSKVISKKQLSEIFRVYFYDVKKNKARSKVSTIMFMLWFAVIMTGVLGGIFTMLSRKLCAPMAVLDMGWMYFALMGLLAILLGTFGSVFNTFSGLYLSKDNDLLFREFKHFTSSPGYMLNSGLGIFLMPICAVILLWKGRKLFMMLNGMFGGQDGSVLLLVTIMLCCLISMDIMTAPSISLEGKSLWIAQSLPVTPWQILRAKLDMQLILNSIPVMLCMICTAAVCPFKIAQFVMMILQVLSYVFVIAVFDLFMGVMKPVLTWTNELTPIKQSVSVMITMFGGFRYTALLFIGYMVLPGYSLGYTLYIGIFIVVNVVAGLTLYIWLKTKGCERFSEL